MGVIMMNKSGMFYPKDYGLVVGDTLELVLVGGGAASTASEAGGEAQIPATGTFFGSYFSARPGIGRTDGGSPGGKSTVSQTVQTGAGGGGGFFPGQAYQGGAGCSTTVPAGTIIYMKTSGGTASRASNDSTPISTYIFGANSGNFGGGNGYGDVSQYQAPGFGGSGYGAGGGGYAKYTNSNSMTALHGGAGGEILYATHIITQEDIDNGIPVTVGMGGIWHGSNKPASIIGVLSDGTSLINVGYDREMLEQSNPIPGIDAMFFGASKSAEGNALNGYTRLFHLDHYNDQDYGAIVPIYTASDKGPPRFYGLWFMYLNRFFPAANCWPSAYYDQEDTRKSFSTTRFRHFICNGYLVATNNSTSTGRLLMSVSLKDIVNETLTEKSVNAQDIITQNAYPFGCVGADLIYMQSATSYKIWKNWRPDMTTEDAEDVTTNESIASATSTNGNVVSIQPDATETSGFLCTDSFYLPSFTSAYFSSSGTSKKYVINRITGETDSMTLSMSGSSFPAYYGFDVIRASSSSSESSSLERFNVPGQTTNYYALWNLPSCVEPGKESGPMVQVTSSSDYLYMAIATIPGYTWTFIMTYENAEKKADQPIPPANAIFGYAGHSGMPQQASSNTGGGAGGAGGCCLISW